MFLPHYQRTIFQPCKAHGPIKECDLVLLQMLHVAAYFALLIIDLLLERYDSKYSFNHVVKYATGHIPRLAPVILPNIIQTHDRTTLINGGPPVDLRHKQLFCHINVNHFITRIKSWEAICLLESPPQPLLVQTIASRARRPFLNPSIILIRLL